MKDKKKKHRYRERRLKLDGKLNPEDVFNLTKREEHEFKKAAFDEKQQKERDFQIGGVMNFTSDFKIGEAGVSIGFVRSLFPSLG